MSKLKIPMIRFELTTTEHTVFDFSWIRGKIRGPKLARAGTFHTASLYEPPALRKKSVKNFEEMSTSAGSAEEHGFTLGVSDEEDTDKNGAVEALPELDLDTLENILGTPGEKKSLKVRVDDARTKVLRKAKARGAKTKLPT